MKFYLLILMTILSLNIFAQPENDSIDWIDIEEVSELFTERQKPVMIYFYKDDCDSCRLQETTTFSLPEVANYINILFYPIKININTKDTIKFFDGKSYINSQKNGGMHDLTYMLCGEQDTFPTIVIFSKRAQGRAFYGYKNRDEIFRRLIYYAEDIDKWTEYEQWEKYHKKGYPPGQEQIVTRLLVKWKTLDETSELHKKQPRKMLLNLYNYNKISSTLMRTQTFNQPDIAKYLNEKYYPVSIDVFTKDTLQIKGIDYINEDKPHKYHQLPIAALEGKMIFPSFIILDEDNKVIEKFQRYLTPDDIEIILHYYGEDKYKEQTIEEFKKTFKSSLNK